jgi:hypothetical protein
MYNFEENVVVPVFVFEKDAINRVVRKGTNKGRYSYIDRRSKR